MKLSYGCSVVNAITRNPIVLHLLGCELYNNLHERWVCFENIEWDSARLCSSRIDSLGDASHFDARTRTRRGKLKFCQVWESLLIS